MARAQARQARQARQSVRKTYKLFIGGDFPRSESGHSYVVNDVGGRFVANAALASRKDARDAVSAARKAFPGWAGRTAYNRGQVLYRAAEVMEDRRPQFVDAVRQGEGGTSAAAGRVVDATIDRLVWYAGWTDKLAQVVGNANPVAGPFFNLSTPEPTGVVAVLAPAGSSLLGLVSVVAPVIVGGNTVVVAAAPERPLPAVTFAEVLATSDVPGGVVNVLTGSLDRTAPTLASHMDVNGIDLTGLAGDPEQARALEESAAENLKRVRRAPAAEPDWTGDPGLEPMTTFLETKTVWHPIGV
jgi:acyl-CoA reductase-like NAD-dependent aldehyde dehydrogenase